MMGEKFWAISRQSGGHAEADHVPVCWSFALNLSPLCLHKYPISELRKKKDLHRIV